MLNPDSTLLSWITAEVSQALSVVREQMAKFSAEPQNGALLQPLKAQRGLFQRGVLAWLRNPPAGVEDMTPAIQALYRLAPQLPEPRALWWAALAVLEIMQHSKDADWTALAKPLCNKLDFH